MPKYEEASYLNDQNEWELVSYLELASEERRADLRERDLREKPQGFFQLGIRNHPQTPHFFEKKPIRTDLQPGIKESEEHNKQQKMICAFLNKYEKHSLGYYERPWDKQDKGYESLIKIKNYTWDKEVRFGLIYGKYVVFDIFGRDEESLALTDKSPFIAIEVVDTHFHSQKAFKVLLETSKNLPLIVGYMFLPVTPQFNSVKKPLRSNSFSSVRFHCYISDGSFWYRNERLEDLYEVSPEAPEVYYNLIKEKLYEDRYIRAEP